MMKYAIVIAGLVICCGLRAQTFAIGHVQTTYTDAARANRSVPAEICYPAQTAGESVPCAADTFPLVVFGHGFVMTWSAYQNIWQSFVQQGYIVVFPTTEGSFSPVHADFGADLAFLITAIQQEAASNTSSILYNHVGVHSALMGHSMGGGSAFLAAAGNATATTLVTFAAANTNPSSIAAAGNVTIPALVIAGQNDCVAPPAQHQLPMYDSLASSCKAYVSINGGGHCYFAETNFNCSFGEGTCTPNPTITRAQQQDAAQDFALMWMDYYLKGNCAALNRFNDSMQTSSRITGNYTCGHTGPVISVNGNNLQSTPALSYQWLLNGSPVAGEMNDTILPAVTGNYSVVATFANSNCPDTSNVINWIIQHTGDYAGISGVQLFPVPVNNEFHLSFTAELSDQCMLVITDVQGRVIDSRPQTVVNGVNDFTVQTATMADGIYVIRLLNAQGDALFTRPLSVVHN